MQKFIITIFTLALLSIPANAETWVAADRVSVVGNNLITKNNLPAKTTFQVVNGAADNTNTSLTNTIQISATDLTYAGTDTEVAAVVAHEIGQIINGKASKRYC